MQGLQRERAHFLRQPKQLLMQPQQLFLHPLTQSLQPTIQPQQQFFKHLKQAMRGSRRYVKMEQCRQGQSLNVRLGQQKRMLRTLVSQVRYSGLLSGNFGPPVTFTDSPTAAASPPSTTLAGSSTGAASPLSILFCSGAS